MDPEIVDALVRAGEWEALTRYVESVRESAEDKPPKYYYTCWKCDKAMWEDSEDESTKIVEGYSGSAKNKGKNFFDQYHAACGSNEWTVGFCTCDRKNLYTVATCAAHSEELISRVSEKKKDRVATIDILQGMRIEDCRKSGGT